MPGMARRLLQQVHEHPAKAHRRIRVRAPAQLIQAAPGEGYPVRLLPRLAVRGGHGAEGVARPGLVAGEGDVLPGKPAQDPGDLSSGHMLDEPQQARTGTDRRPSRRAVIQAGDLADQRIPLIMQQGMQGLSLTARQPQRCDIGHHDTVRGIPAAADPSAAAPSYRPRQSSRLVRRARKRRPAGHGNIVCLNWVATGIACDPNVHHARPQLAQTASTRARR